MSIENRIYNFVDGYDTNGQSVYDIWKQAGNLTGKAIDFFEFLKTGEQGDPGDIGPEGLPGRSAYEVWLAKEGNEGKTVDEFFNQTKKVLYMKGSDDGKTYTGSLVNGVLTFESFDKLYIETEPKTAYVTGEAFDPTGMVVMAELEDGTTKEITNYTYEENFANNQVIIKYSGFEVIIEITVYESMELMLQDFTYTVNEDGTYELNTWKGTYNGETSTRCIIPNHELITA